MKDAFNKLPSLFTMTLLCQRKVRGMIRGVILFSVLFLLFFGFSSYASDFNISVYVRYEGGSYQGLNLKDGGYYILNNAFYKMYDSGVGGRYGAFWSNNYTVRSYDGSTYHCDVKAPSGFTLDKWAWSHIDQDPDDWHYLGTKGSGTNYTTGSLNRSSTYRDSCSVNIYYTHTAHSYSNGKCTVCGKPQHTHNKNKKTYAEISGDNSYHTTHYYCDANDKDWGTVKESHSYGSWSGWTDLKNGQLIQQRKCSLCGHIQYNYKYITYTIAFNKNGGTGGSTSSMSMTYGTAKNLTANGFSKTGYSFAGWATSASGSVAYKDKASVNNLTKTDGTTVTLYAKWTPNTYKIEFISAGDKVGSTASDSTGSTVTGTMDVAGPYAYDQSYNLPKNQFARTGYKFEGWTQNKDGSGKVFPDKGQFSNLTAADNGVVQLYAKWSVKKYTIKYILHGFTLQNPVTEYTVEDSILIPDLASTEKKEFKKWVSYEAGAGDLMPGCKNIGYKNNVMTIPKGTYGNLTFEVDWKPVGDGISSSETVVNHFKIKI